MVPVDDFSRDVSCGGSASFVGDNPDRTVVWLRGEHDPSTVAALSGTMARAVALDTAGLIVDLSDVQFMDASTVGVIVRTRALLGPRFLVLRSPSRCARRVLELCGLAELLDPASVGPTRMTGDAGALGTWVAVPATERAGGRVDASAPTDGGEPELVGILRAAPGEHASSVDVPAGSERGGSAVGRQGP